MNNMESEIRGMVFMQRNYFAGLAMQALIAKAPFFDRDGVNGMKYPEGGGEQFRADIAASAFAYADAMLKESVYDRNTSII